MKLNLIQRIIILLSVIFLISSFWLIEDWANLQIERWADLQDDGAFSGHGELVQEAYFTLAFLSVGNQFTAVLFVITITTGLCLVFKSNPKK